MKKRGVIILMALAGVALFIYVVFHAGPERIWNTLKRMSLLEFLFLILLRLLFWGLRSLNWHGVLSRLDGKSRLTHLLGARMAGHAMGYMTPTSRIGGDAFKALMVNEIPQRKVIASVVIDKTIELLATALMIPVAVGMIIVALPLSLGRTILFLLAPILILALIILLIQQQKRGLFTRLLNLMSRLKLKISFLERHREKIAETDANMAEFYSKHRDRFALVFLGYLVFIALWTVEIYITLRFLGCSEITPGKSFLIVIIGSVSFILPGVPGSVGVYEMTYLSLFALLNLPVNHAVGLILVRRALDLIMAGWGTTIIIARGKSAWRKMFPLKADKGKAKI